MARWNTLTAMVSFGLAVTATPGAVADESNEVVSPIEQAYGAVGLPAGSTLVNDYTIELVSGDLLAIDEPAIIEAAGLPAPDAVDDCIADLQCWWADTDYSGQNLFVYDTGDDGVPWTDVPPNFNETMASWRNHDAQDAKWAKGSIGGGEQFCMDEHSRNPNVSPDRNTMTSFRVYGVGANPC